MNILAICGSLRRKSSNLAVLHAVSLLAPAPMQVTLFDGLTTLPYFNPDLDGDNPPIPVRAFRNAIEQADALIICSPEYARGVAGVMKNALDWLVGDPEFLGKPVVVINTSQRATNADVALRLTLETMSAKLIEKASITLPLLGRGLNAAAIAADPGLNQAVTQALAELADALTS